MNKCQFYCNYISNRSRSSGGGGGSTSWLWDPESAWQDIVDTCESNRGKEYTDTVTKLDLGTSTPNSSHHMGLILVPGGYIYHLPYASNYIISIDVNNDTVTNIGDFSSLDSSCKCYSGALTSNGYIYIAPYEHSYFMKINTYNNNVTTVPSSLNYLTCGTLAPNNNIYFPPYYNSDKIIKLSSINDSLQELPGSVSDSGASLQFYSSVLAPNGNIYCASNASTSSGYKILKIDTATDTFTAIGDYGKNYLSCTLAPNNCIYCTPKNSTNPILKVDTSDDTITPIYLSIPEWVYNGATISHSKSVLAPNGCIYSICRYKYSSSKYKCALFKLDTASDICTYYSTDIEHRLMDNLSNLILATNGCIYVADCSYTNILLKIDPGSSVNTNFQTNTLLSPYLNKY